MGCFVTDDLAATKESVLKNCHGDLIRINEIGDIEFRRKDGASCFYVSRQDIGVLVRFLVEQMEAKLND
jgi:hypothetical protein